MPNTAVRSLVASAAVATVIAAAALTFAPTRHATAEAEGLYVNAVDLVIVPSEMPKFLEAIRENGVNAVKEPGCRMFNIAVQQGNPNHVFLFEVYDNAAALDAHRQTPHFKKYAEATKNMIADRSVHPLTAVAMNSK